MKPMVRARHTALAGLVALGLGSGCDGRLPAPVGPAFLLPMTPEGGRPDPMSPTPPRPEGDGQALAPPDPGPATAPEVAGATETSPTRGATPPTRGGVLTPGTVLVEGPAGARPLVGATVYTSDGRLAHTGADGRFALPGGPPADGTWVAAAPGHVTSAVTGLPAPPTLHLREQATTRPQQALGPAKPLELRGEVRDAQGQPAPNVLVAVGAAELVAGIPVRTDPQGRWTSRTLAAGGRLTAATVLAVGLEGQGLGVARGLEAAAGAGDLGVLTLTPTSLAATVALDAGELQLPTRVELRAVTDDGVSLPLFGPDGTGRAAQLPGVRYALRVTAEDATGAIRSEIQRPDLPVDWSEDTFTWREALLPIPRLTAPLADLYPGLELAWQPVAGAGGYLLEVQAVEAVPELPWEAFTTDTRLPFLWRGASWPRGAFDVTLRALDAPGLSTRALAAVGPRRLRSWQSREGWRASFRRVQVQR
ncbi:MAG: hypothetical protein VKQ33_10315 [Candidatus Sericytochromatia bacterium]|nr:hypothetical protein [Candidatus Sericytochromatia bacterium]